MTVATTNLLLSFLNKRFMENNEIHAVVINTLKALQNTVYFTFIGGVSSKY